MIEENYTGSHYFYPIRNIGGNNGGDNFDNLTQFDYTVPEGYIVKFNESYNVVEMTVQGITGGAYVTIGNAAFNGTHADNVNRHTTTINSNGVKSLFNNIEHITNDIQISNIKNSDTVSQVMDIIFESKNKLKNNNSLNPFYINKNSVNVANAAIGGNIDSYFTENSNTYTIKRREANRSPFFYSSTNQLIFKPLLSSFQDENIFYSGSNHRFNYFIDPQWRNKFIYAVGANGSLPVDIGEFKANPGNNGKINVVVKSFTLYVSVYKYLADIPKQIKYDFTEIFTSTRIMTPSNQEKWTVYIPKNTFRIFLTFVDKRALNGERTYSTTDLRVDDIRKKINQIFIEYNGKMYPSDQYNLISMSPVNTAPGENIYDWTENTNTEDLTRAYNDLLLYSGAHYDSNGFSLNFSEYLLNPLWCFNINQKDIGRSENLDITIRGSSAFSTFNACFLICLHKSSLTIDYNDNGFIKNVDFNKYP